MKRTAFIAFVLVTTVYIFLGSLVFHFIEGANETEEKKTFELDHQKFLEAHTCLTQEELRDYIAKVLEAASQGVSVMTIISKDTNQNTTNSNDTSTNTTTLADEDDDSNWNIVSAFLFCITVVSTIGYGKLTPKTEAGQAFCMLFALIGVPLFATSMVGVGERLQIPLRRIKKCRPWYKNDPKKDARLKTGVFLTTGICLLVFVPSFVLSKTEDWTLIESMYFCIITMTTIGFGDYVPDWTNNKLAYYFHRVLLCVWILLGLSWVALILSELASIMKEQIVEAAQKTSDKFGDLEDKVKRKAKDARDRLAQKASIHWRRRSRSRSSGVYKFRKDESSHAPDIAEDVQVTLENDTPYLTRNPSRISPTNNHHCGEKGDNEGTPGVYRTLESSINCPPNNDRSQEENRGNQHEESLSRVEIR